jgi:hypothetical protein
MPPEFKQGAINRRGCLLIVAIIVLTLVVLGALGLGLLGNVDGGKATDLTVVSDGGT